MRRFAIVVLVVTVLTAGCVAPAAEPGELGQESGYRYDADLSVTTADGLNESEREAVVGRTMARIEHLRGLEFTNTTNVTVISRAEFRNRSGRSSEGLTTEQRWNEQVWEALHIVGEDETLPGSRATNRGTSVVGYYSSSRKAIVLVSDSETPRVDRRTLVHELVHALQDQQLNLGKSRSLQDEQLAVRGVVEGDANYVRSLYQQRCNSGWDCLAIPDSDRSQPAGFNQGLFLVSFLPYAQTGGPAFVESIRQRGGWERVNELYDQYPTSTEQLIHPEQYPDDEPTNVSLPDRSDSRWGRFTNMSRPVHDTVGEGSIYAMFVSAGVVDRSGPDLYDYDHPLSAGWDGDWLVPYRTSGGEYGYVWRLRWETTEDAREFVEGYREIMRSYDARSLGDGRYVVRDGGFADAFRISRDGTTVTIVNAPRQSELDRIHPPA